MMHINNSNTSAIVEFHKKTAYERLKLKLRNKTKKYRKKSIATLSEIVHSKTLRSEGRDAEEAPGLAKRIVRIILYVVVSVGTCILLSSPITIFPHHDSLQFPEYWYEHLISGNLSITVSISLLRMMECKFLFKIESMVSLNAFLYLYGIWILATIVPSLVYYAIWVAILSYNPPMPLNGIIWYLGVIVTIIATWFQIPSDERVKENVRKKFRAYFFFEFFVSFYLCIQYDGFTLLFETIQPELQWILAFVLPITREINIRLLNKILRYAFDDYEFVTNINCCISHALFVTVQLGTTATTTSAYCMLAVDYLLNLYSTAKIIKLSLKIKSESSNMAQITEKLKSELLTLTVVEMIEILSPLAYLSTLLLAYYGPNKNILGNVKGGQWQNTKIEDIGILVVSILELFFVDLSSVIVGGLLLWKVCSIDILREIYEAMKSYWHMIAVELAIFIAVVSRHSFCK